MSSSRQQQFDWAQSEAFLNKERRVQEQGTWKNRTGTIDDLLAVISQGHATTAPLALGSEMRRWDAKSERCNENANPSALMGFDLDGDTTLEELMDTQFAKTKVMAISTSARHLRIGDPPQHRLRVYLVVEGGVVPIAYLPAVRAVFMSEMCGQLGIEGLKDECGKEPARIWYGNTGPSHPIGDGDDRPAGPLEQHVLGNTIAYAEIQQIIEQSPEPVALPSRSEGTDGYEVGTPYQIHQAKHILSSGILSDERASSYEEWVRLLHVVKKLDPDQEHLIEPFLTFSQQSPHHDACIEDIYQKWEMLPPSEVIMVGITALREAATEDTPGWEDNCPSMGRAYTKPEAAGFIGTSPIAGPMLSHLKKMYEAAGLEPPDFNQMLGVGTPKQPTKASSRSSKHQRQPTKARSILRNQPRRTRDNAPSTLRSTFNGYEYDEVVTHQQDKNSDF